jgi:hypothetical protein
MVSGAFAARTMIVDVVAKSHESLRNRSAYFA